MGAQKISKLIEKSGMCGRATFAIAALTFVFLLLPLRPTAAQSSVGLHWAQEPAPAGPAPAPSPAPIPLPTLDPHATAVPAPVATQWAISGPPTPVVVGTPSATPGSSNPGGVIAPSETGHIVESITRAFYTIIFPVESMEDALRGVFTHFLSGSLEAAESVFAEAVDAIVLSVPDDEVSSYRAPWTGMLRISAALWPLTFVIVLTGAAKESLVTSAPVGFADTKKGLLDWLISVALAAGSLLILTWVNELFQEITQAILVADFGIFGSLDAHAIAGTLLNGAILGGFTALVPFGGLFIAFFFIILAFSVLVSLFLVYVAKYTLLFVLIVIAPFVLTISVLPPTRWLNWTWIRMVLLVSLLGPVNALLLKLASLATIQQAGAMGELNLVPAVVHFFKLMGVLSLLLTVNFTVAKTTFGAVNEVKDRAVDATKQVAGMIVSAVAVGAAALTGAAIGGAAMGGAAVGGGGLAAGGSAAAVGAGRTAAGAQAAASIPTPLAGGVPVPGTVTSAGSQVPANAGSSAMRTATAQIGSRDNAVTSPPSQAPVAGSDAEAQTSVEDGDAGATPGIRGDAGATPGIRGDAGATSGIRGDAGATPGIRGDAGATPGAAQPPAFAGTRTLAMLRATREQRTTMVSRILTPGIRGDPGPRRGALAGALQVGGATLSAVSGSRFGRGAGTAARVGGWMMERKMDREERTGPEGKPAGQPALRSGSTNVWRGMAAGLGASSPAGYAATTGPLSRLEEQYGFDATRNAVQESLGPAIAARRFGNETAPSMATQDGFYTRGPGGQPQADVSAWIGSTVENRLRTMPGGAHTGPRIYPDSPPSAPAASGGLHGGSAPSLLDFRQGAQMAEALGYGSHDQEAIRALASLHHVHRNPGLGFDAGSARATVEAAWRAQSALAGVPHEQPGTARTAFLHDVTQIARDHGHTDEFIYPTPWSNLAARIRADAGIDRQGQE